MLKLQTEQKQTNTMRKHMLLFTGAIEAVVGILLLLNPVEFTSGILIISGIALSRFRHRAARAVFPARPAAGRGRQPSDAGAFAASGRRVLRVPFVVVFRDVSPCSRRCTAAAILVVGVGKIQFAADRFRLHAAGWKGGGAQRGGVDPLRGRFDWEPVSHHRGAVAVCRHRAALFWAALIFFSRCTAEKRP